MGFLISLGKNCKIPVIEFYADDVIVKKPLIIMLHGYMGFKELLLPQAYNLAKRGFFLVLPDAYCHGERNTSNKPCSFFDAVLKTTDEIDYLIESYSKDERVDISNIGLTGFSMGGCITFNYIARDTKLIKAAVPVLSTPDWVSIMKTEAAYNEFSTNGLIKSKEEMEQYVTAASKLQPLNKLSNMKDTPLLILNGDIDPIIPVSEVASFYNQLKLLYHCEEDIRLSIYKGIGHLDNLQMNMELADWFVKYLNT